MLLQESFLFKYITNLGQTNSRASIFAGKLLELDDTLADVLALIRRIFPHYTEHGRRHYLTLIHRMGQFLPTHLVDRLSSTECFLLMASAMLHDIGMVVAEEELRAIDKNKDFVEFRARFPHLPQEHANDLDPHLIAILEREVVAEYFRTCHHKRSAKFVFSHFGKFLDPFGAPSSRLVKVLATVCEGHGLGREELENETRFPVNVDIDGENANVRLLAATLRVADLLDMDSRRTCPLILRLVSPLPDGSNEHWKRHELDDLSVSPTEIRIGRKCTNPDEQWSLYLWVSWLDAEIRHTTAILAGNSRTPLTLPIPNVHITSDGSYSFPNYSFPLVEKPKTPQMLQLKKICPSCQTLLSYCQRRKRGNVKALECAKCRIRLISIESEGEFLLQRRDLICEEISCPRCKKRVMVNVDPVPGAASAVTCSSCNENLRVIRGTESMSVRVARPISFPVEEEFLEAVAEAMGPQPWKKGQLKKAAEKLGATQHSISKAIQHLIRAGKFKFQVRGKLYSPEP
jgi:hypothetical protein